MLSKSDKSEAQELEIFRGDKFSFPERKGQVTPISEESFDLRRST